MSSESGRAFHWPDGKRAGVSLSFDDARLSQVDRGTAILDACGARATFYVSIAGLDQRLEAWKRAVASGHEIGNHSRNHPCSGNFPFARDRALENYTLRRMEDELLDANDAVAERLGVACETFAYPCGQKFVGRGQNVQSYVPLVAGHFVVGRDGFNETHNAPGFCDLAQVFSVEADTRSFQDLRAMVDRAAEEGGWLIFFGHEIGEAGIRQTTDAAALEALCRYCLDDGSGIWLDTVAAVGKYIRNKRGS